MKKISKFINLRSILAVAAFVTTLAAGLVGGNAVAGHGQIKYGELKDLLTGATVTGKTPRGTPYTMTFDAGGSIKYKLAEFRDKGNWWIEGNAYCTKWKIISQGAVSCREIFHKDGDRYRIEYGIGESVDVKISR